MDEYDWIKVNRSKERMKLWNKIYVMTRAKFGHDDSVTCADMALEGFDKKF